MTNFELCLCFKYNYYYFYNMNINLSNFSLKLYKNFKDF